MENLIVSNGSKTEKYESLLPQIKALCEGEDDMIANMANISAAISQTFNFLWIGFYIVKENNNFETKRRLVLGPFQGPVACTSISYGKGVCGTAWKESKTLVVPDVEKFPGHIACSSLSRSEIVVPLIINESVTAVLDIDSNELAAFDEVDANYLQQILTFLI